MLCAVTNQEGEYKYKNGHKRKQTIQNRKKVQLLAYENEFKLVSSQRKIKQYVGTNFYLLNGQNIKKAYIQYL